MLLSRIVVEFFDHMIVVFIAEGEHKDNRYTNHRRIGNKIIEEREIHSEEKCSLFIKM